MDNKKISVDDLFRQRFADREAPLPPGAWSRMEGLLDAKMPVGGASVAAPQRRGWIFLLVGLLVAGGGTFLYQSMPENAAVAENPPTGLVSSDNSASKPTAESVVEKAAPPATPSEVVSSAGRPATARPVAASGKKESQPAASYAAAAAQTIPATKVVSVPAVSVGKNTASTVSIRKPAGATPSPAPVLGEVSAPPAPALIREEVSPLSWVASRAAAVFSGKTIHPAQIARVENYLLQWAAGENHPATVASNNWSAKIPAPSQPNPIAQPAGGKQLSASNIEKAALPSGATLKTVAAAHSATAPALVPALDQKLDAAVEDLQKARFAFGLLAGINSTLSGGAGALQGLHAGIAGLLRLSEKWQLGAELRYSYRLNNSMNLKDDYFSGKTLNEATVMRNGRPYNAVRYEIDSMLSRYSFTAYSSLELPLQVRYHHKRMAFYGGPSLGFHFAPNVTRTDTRIATISRYDTLDAALPLPTLTGRASDVSLSDFDSRFSLGYNLGAQYRLTPALHLDFRLSQQLWDHGQSRSAGSRRVSDTYLHIPSLQLSVGYFFGENPAPQKKKKN